MLANIFEFEDTSKQYLILPGFGIISNVIASAAKKAIFGYIAMVYGASLGLLFRCVASQQYTKTSFYIGGVSQVAFVVTRRGKAWYDGKLRCNTHRQNDFIRFVDKIMVKNLLRSAGTTWTLLATCVYGYVV